MPTKLTDIIVPEIFTPYMMQTTMQRSALIQSGAVVASPQLSAFLAGEGLTAHVRSFRDLANDDENVSSDDETVFSTPKKIQSLQEIQVRMSRNQSWSSMDLLDSLISPDPMDAIASRVSSYWTRRLQAAFVATMKGVFADNAAAPTGTDQHTQNDLTRDVSGSSFSLGVTTFSASAFLEACLTMGDNQEALSMLMVHSVVYNRMQANNLIDFIPDSVGMVNIPTFLGRRVIVDDGLPSAGGVFESWLFRQGTVLLGMGSPKVPTEVERIASAGNGAGQETLHSRMELALHPSGHAYIGTPPAGGPSNAATSNNLAAASSWSRVFGERKQIGMARLITREA